MDILAISYNILIVGGAIIIILGVIAMLYIISILIKVNSMIKDIKNKYSIAVGIMFKPFEFLQSLIHKITK